MTSEIEVGPAPGPIWLTRSRLVPSYWRGMSRPKLPSCCAMYSRLKSEVELAAAFGVSAADICVSTPGEFSPHSFPAESMASSVFTRSGCVKVFK